MIWFKGPLAMVLEILIIKFLKRADSSKIHDITLNLVANTSKIIVQNPMSHKTFLKSTTRSFR